MVLKESKTSASLNPSTSRAALYCPAPLCSSPTAVQAYSRHHPYRRGNDELREAWTCWRGAHGHLKRHPHHPQDKKPSSLTNSQLEDEPGKMTASKLHPSPAWRPLAETGVMSSPQAAGALCLCALPRCDSLRSPGTSQLFFAWPFFIRWNKGKHSCAINTERKNDKVGETLQQASGTEPSANLRFICKASAVYELHKKEVWELFRTYGKETSTFPKKLR